jgi:hypothetical protein
VTQRNSVGDVFALPESLADAFEKQKFRAISVLK